MLVEKYYGDYKHCKTAFVVTHPNKDDINYFLESVHFAFSIGLPYYHLGKTFSLYSLENVYEYFVALNTVGVIGSSAGDWENAINELARAAIPFYMNKNLNSFKPLTETIGIKTHGPDFSCISKIIDETSILSPS